MVIRTVVGGPGDRTCLAALVLTLFASLFAPDLSADYLHYRDGRLLDGRFVSIGPAGYSFRAAGNGKIYTVPLKVASLSIGFAGVPACIAMRSWSRPDCTLRVFQIGKDYILAGRARPGSVFYSVVRLRVAQVALLRFEGDGTSNRALPRIEPGVPLDLFSPAGTRGMVVEKVTATGIRVRLVDGTRRDVSANRLRAASRGQGTLFTSDRPAPRRVIWTFVVPGLPQFQAGRRWQGGAFLLGTLAVVGSVIGETRAARGTVRRMERDLLYRYFHSWFGGRKDRALYRHQRNQWTLGTSALFLYLWHWYDALQPNAPARTSVRGLPRLQFAFQPGVEVGGLPGTAKRRAPGVHFQFSLSF